MDARPPFTRPPDMHSHSHSQSQSHQSQQFAPYPSHTTTTTSSSTTSTSQPQPQPQPQPPIHMPFAANPYPAMRHDPFLPQSAQHARSSSNSNSNSNSNGYGVMQTDGPSQGDRHGGWNTARLPSGAHLHHSNPPRPPPPTMSHPSGQSYGYDAPRRRSLGAASPSNPYAPSHDAPPPPPPQQQQQQPFSRPHMPPPLSPQQQQQHQQHQQHQHHASQPQRPYQLPGLGHHRPGSSMSISNLIGGTGDTPGNATTSQSQSSPHSNAPSSMQPPSSPRRGISSAPRSDFHPFRRSPDRHMYGSNAQRPSEAHAYGAASPSRSYGPHGSPEQGRPSMPQSSQPYKPMVFQGQRSYPPPPNDPYARDPRNPLANVPPRPNSQPLGPGHQGQEQSAYESSGTTRRVPYGQPEERRRTLGESHHARPNVAELVGGPQSERDRPSTVQPVSHSTFSPPRDPRGVGSNPPSRNPWRQSIPEEPREHDGKREDAPPVYRGYGGYSAPPQGPSPFGQHGPQDMVRGRSLDHLSHRAMEQYHAAPTSDPNSVDRQKPEQLSRSLSSGGSGYPRALHDPRRMGDLAFGPDANRRTGRASPLPQAVQGAQAQPLSIGKDPHVKSEFGRMFSGLGGLGSSTPSRGSPMPPGSHDALPPGTDLNEHLRLQRVNSQNGRKPKRVKDEEGGYDHDDMDGRGTPLGMRGAKRNKHGHPGHHHHHHAHHHHHHHHKPDEEAPSNSSTPFGARQPNLPQNGAGQHHHHHYHSAPHHHHHAPRPNQPAPPSPKLYPKIHDIQAVLDEAAKHPRRHLGSHLYDATTELPKPNSSVDDQFGYASKPKPLPRFERDPINCTFTVRVPRFYLKPRQRQQIVLQRHLWGAQIFRDDSDPIAAAIHSGWIRGEWDDTVNVNLLDPRITAPHDASDAQDTLTKPPKAPVNPPADMDLQIDILVLPRIQEYAGTVEYGISSRRSKMHDGLSFMIHKLRWVEEGVGSRGQERTAAAMKRRLDASATLLSLLSGGGEDALRAVNGTAKLHA